MVQAFAAKMKERRGRPGDSFCDQYLTIDIAIAQQPKALIPRPGTQVYGPRWCRSVDPIFEEEFTRAHLPTIWHQAEREQYLAPGTARRVFAGTDRAALSDDRSRGSPIASAAK